MLKLVPFVDAADAGLAKLRSMLGRASPHAISSAATRPEKAARPQGYGGFGGHPPMKRQAILPSSTNSLRQSLVVGRSPDQPSVCAGRPTVEEWGGRETAPQHGLE
jgi:hypothetical protein